MQTETATGILVETVELPSAPLERTVRLTLYLPATGLAGFNGSLLLINDGQDLVTMEFDKMLGYLVQTNALKSLLCIGIHCGEDRKNEYGMIASPDFKGRGSKAGLYQQFIFEELLPWLYGHLRGVQFSDMSFAGFSLGGLSALDLVWNHPDVFSTAGVFSGSLWWRSKDKEAKDYNEANDRLMHRQVRKGNYRPGLKFFFECGELDEMEDRNRNGVIDSIDDTLDLMRELQIKGYLEGKDMFYLQMSDGRHDVPSWARALPVFLRWRWGK